MKTIILILGIISSFNVKADWINSGAGYECNESFGIFKLVSVLKSSSPQLNEPTRKIENILKNGINNFSCKLKNLLIETSITINPPSGGMCMGGGWVEINHLKINGKVLKKYETLGIFCGGSTGEQLINFTVFSNSGIKPEITQCHSSEWDGVRGYRKLRCETREFKNANKQVKTVR